MGFPCVDTQAGASGAAPLRRSISNRSENSYAPADRDDDRTSRTDSEESLERLDAPTSGADTSSVDDLRMLLVEQFASVQMNVAAGLQDTLQLVSERLPGLASPAQDDNIDRLSLSNNDRLLELQAENLCLKQQLSVARAGSYTMPSASSEGSSRGEDGAGASPVAPVRAFEEPAAPGARRSITAAAPAIPSRNSASNLYVPGKQYPGRPVYEEKRNSDNTEGAVAVSLSEASIVDVPGIPGTIEQRESIISGQRQSIISGASSVYSAIVPVATSGRKRGQSVKFAIREDDDEKKRDKRFAVLPVWEKSRKSVGRKSAVQDPDPNNFHWPRLSDEDAAFGMGRTVSLPCCTDRGLPDAEAREVMSSGELFAWARKHRQSRAMTDAESILKKLVVNPNSIAKAGWDFISCLLVFYDIFMIPFELMAPTTTFFVDILMVWMARLFWTFDVPLSFLSGFVRQNGDIEMKPKPIALKYFRTWFIFDFLLVGESWLEFAVANDTFGLGILRIGKASRALRVARMARLLRLIRIREILMVIAERVRSEKLILLADILKISLATLLFAHVVACVWYGIGNTNDLESENWVDHYGVGTTESTLAFRYLVSLHWSLTQFAGGMDEYVPQNVSERGYVCAMFMLAFLLAGVFVSRLTSSMTRLAMLSNNQAQQLVSLRRYLYQNGISHKLALRVQRSAKYALSEQVRLMSEDKAELLNFVSEPLRAEVHYELYRQVLLPHPFFRRYLDHCRPVMRRMCHAGFNQENVSLGDIIFNSGEKSKIPKMYFVTRGELLYAPEMKTDDMEVEIPDGTAVDTAPTIHSRHASFQQGIIPLGPGTWLSEPMLWTHWTHRGVFTAVSNCCVYVLNAKAFQDIYTEFEHPSYFDPRKYAAAFVDQLNRAPESEAHDAFKPKNLYKEDRRRDSGRPTDLGTKSNTAIFGAEASLLSKFRRWMDREQSS